MAPPPKYVITRKLINHFFQSYLPKTPIILSTDENKLFECWENFGIDSPKCEEYEDLFDRAHEKTKNYGKRIESLNLKGYVLSNLKPPVYKGMKKGRFQDKPIFDKKDIFDGLF